MTKIHTRCDNWKIEKNKTERPKEIASGFFVRVLVENNHHEDYINPKGRSFKNQRGLVILGWDVIRIPIISQWNHTSFDDGEMRSQTSKQAPRELAT